MVIVENPGLETAVSAVRLEELFARQVAAVPENTAVIAGARQLSYRALDRAASRLARHSPRGIGPGDLVGVCLDRSVELAVAPLAVLKAGAAYVPLEISFPADRLAYMLNDIQAKVVLVDAPGRAKLAPTTAEAILVDAEALLAETAADGTTAAPRAAQHGRPTRLCDLHLRIDRLAQRREDHPSGGGEHDPGCQPTISRRPRRSRA